MQRYTVAQVGTGPRGRTHLDGFVRNSDRFELVALCARDENRLNSCAHEFGVPATYTDAEEMLAKTRPDLFCFVTQPNARLAFVELAVAYGVKAIAFEKPMATSLAEAWTITDLCRRNGIKAVVSHQHKYLSSMIRLKEIVDAGRLGDITRIHATSQAWLAQLATHYMDYILWVNNDARARWAVGHIHGTEQLENSHPSPDYLMGQVLFDNGVRAFIESGYLSPAHMPGEFWVDSRLTVYGTHGYAWADTDGGWRSLNRHTGGETIGGTGQSWREQEKNIQVPYLRDLALWLDDDSRVHPCHAGIAYRGYEILEGMCRSALDHAPVSFPLASPATGEDRYRRGMRRELPEVDRPNLISGD